VNRRISIVVMTREADAEAKLIDLPVQPQESADTAGPGEAAAVPGEVSGAMPVAPAPTAGSPLAANH
jgi:hypothetical protein